MDDARALLNSLMGADRDARPEQRRIRKFTDEGICRHYLMGLCPHELFTNTKIDLGVCKMEHNDNLKEQFENDADAEKYRRKWRGALRVQLKGLLDSVDRRIQQNQLRIAREKDQASATEEQKRQINLLNQEVSEKLKKSEALADDGKFEESRNTMKEVDGLKRRIEDVEAKRYEKYKKENICHVCGLIIDAQEVEDMKDGRGWHTHGKQHIGYGLIRSKIKEIEEAQAEDKKNGVASPSPSPTKGASEKDGKKKEGGRAPQQPMAQSEEEAEEIATPSETGTQGGQVGPRAAAGGAGAVAPEAEKAENLKPRAGTSDLEAEESRGLDQGHGGDLDQRRGKGTEGNVRLPGRDLVGGAASKEKRKDRRPSRSPSSADRKEKKGERGGNKKGAKSEEAADRSKGSKDEQQLGKDTKASTAAPPSAEGSAAREAKEAAMPSADGDKGSPGSGSDGENDDAKVLDRASSSTSSEEYAIE
eukprot:CAMPEP_0178405670 /NCGR_PEP_ID=MMETSP0689_2-20121128/18519_1 /TAXON_ID=160604 /ORGANISM="Amphidinium massartii, Strain CS-259" /LENGTH=475 /DNA_ID=CAMNT_0020026693 /DNA_START=79 /DNA_END=1507 /DNA_ORIENTATION=-